MHLFMKRQNMPEGPAGSKNGGESKMLTQRSAPNLMVPNAARDRSMTYPRPLRPTRSPSSFPFTSNDGALRTTPESRSRAGSDNSRSRAGSCETRENSRPFTGIRQQQSRSRGGSAGSKTEASSQRSTSTRRGIKFCRPRRHVPVDETPGAFLAKDLNEFRKAEANQKPVFRQLPSLGKIKGGKPMNLAFNGPALESARFNPHTAQETEASARVVPERFRNLNQDRNDPSNTSGFTWRQASSYRNTVLKPHSNSYGSSSDMVSREEHQVETYAG